MIMFTFSILGVRLGSFCVYRLGVEVVFIFCIVFVFTEILVRFGFLRFNLFGYLLRTLVFFCICGLQLWLCFIISWGNIFNFDVQVILQVNLEFQSEIQVLGVFKVFFRVIDGNMRSSLRNCYNFCCLKWNSYVSIGVWFESLVGIRVLGFVLD